MFIQTEETPNPSAIKFIPDGHQILNSGTMEFKNQKQAATISPLALQLFEIPGIKTIFFGKDFVTITKNDSENWMTLKPEIQATLMDFFISEKPILFVDSNNDLENHGKSTDHLSQEDSDIIKQIKELIEIKVRPAVAMDGGDIIFHSFEDGVVKLLLKGSCSGCPSSTITLKNGIENMLKHYIPEIESVEQVMDHPTDE